MTGAWSPGVVAVLATLAAAQLPPDLDTESQLVEGVQASNTVPMIGKKNSPQGEVSQLLYPYLLRILDLGLRGRQTYPQMGKRSGQAAALPSWLQQDISRLGKRGFPSFSVPDAWKKPKTFSKPSLSKLREEMFRDRGKRTARDSQWFRFSEGTWNPLRRATLHKRAGELHHLKDYNSVPFMGKRSAERGDLAARPGDLGVMVRKPRYDDYEEDGPNPWSYLDMEAAQQQAGLNM